MTYKVTVISILIDGNIEYFHIFWLVDLILD